MTLLPIFRLGGAYAEVDDDDTAFGGPPRAQYAFNMDAIAPTPTPSPPTARGSDRSGTSCARSPRDGGGYVNFMAEADDDRVRATYGAKYDRLARIKATYDPGNVFHRNANIKPA